MPTLPISRFTPSLMSHEDLESVFVQEERVRLLERLVATTRESALTEAKHHSLVIGPRGMGKSHLIALLRHRVAALPELEGKLAVAWLQEDEWGVSGFADLLLRVADALAREEGLRRPRPGVLSRTDPVAEARAALEAMVGDRVLLVLAENLDEVFQGLGTRGQQQLRAYLQEGARWTIVATTPSLFSGVSRHTSPFYGFFAPHHLTELTVEECGELMARLLARWGARDSMKGFLARARVRAMHALAGGNPRVFVMLAQLVASGSVEGATEQILATIDELTPYYQARLQLLSEQQRQIVNCLCQDNRTMLVGEIAEACGLSPQGTSVQLRRLEQMGYVRTERYGRTARYETREPILRLSMQLKRHRGEPARFVVGLLINLFCPEEIGEWLERCEASPAFDRECLAQALEEARTADALEGALAAELVALALSRDSGTRALEEWRAQAEELEAACRRVPGRETLWLAAALAWEAVGDGRRVRALALEAAEHGPKTAFAVAVSAVALVKAARLEEAWALLVPCLRAQRHAGEARLLAKALVLLLYAAEYWEPALALLRRIPADPVGARPLLAKEEACLSIAAGEGPDRVIAELARATGHEAEWAATLEEALWGVAASPGPVEARIRDVERILSAVGGGECGEDVAGGGILLVTVDAALLWSPSEGAQWTLWLAQRAPGMVTFFADVFGYAAQGDATALAAWPQEVRARLEELVSRRRRRLEVVRRFQAAHPDPTEFEEAIAALLGEPAETPPPRAQRGRRSGRAG